MGDLSEMRGLIVVFSFLGIFALLIGSNLFPVGFVSPLANVTSPDYVVKGTDFGVGNYNETWSTFTAPINATGGSFEFGTQKYIVLDVGHDVGGGFYKFGGHDIDLNYIDANATGSQWINWRHNVASWIGQTLGHPMTWSNQNGVDRGYDLYLDELTTDYAANVSRYKVKCDHLYFTCEFWYNTTTDASITAAYNHYRLYMQIGIGFDQFGASFDAWSIIANIILFQPMATEVIPFPFNLVLGFALWACVGYMMFIFVLRVVGAVFGGGGA